MDINVLDNNIILANRVNIELAKNKSLISNNDCKVYSLVQSLYLKAFETFLLSKIDLKKYDDMLLNSELDFGVIPKERKFAYHNLSHMNLSYIYIRNFFFVEKLENNDLKVFFDKISRNDYSVDENIMKIVENTYKDVMVDNFRTDQYISEDTIISYGEHTEKNDCYADALCIYIHYGYSSKNFSEQEYFENKEKKEELLGNITKEITDIISESLKIKADVKVRHVYAL